MLKIRYRDDETPEIGFDEAGRGCFFGPIMAGAVYLPPQNDWPTEFKTIASKIKDSKKINPKKRREYFEIIKKNLNGYFGIGSVGADEINEMGIQWANREAFRRALSQLCDQLNFDKCRLLVDGEITFNNKDGVILPCDISEEILIINGDATYLSIATASILAKVSHDEWIEKWCEKNPDDAERYCLYNCKGYGTTGHREGLKKWGGCKGHRTLFIRNWIPSVNLRSNNSVIYNQDKIKNNENKAESCLIKL